MNLAGKILSGLLRGCKMKTLMKARAAGGFHGMGVQRPNSNEHVGFRSSYLLAEAPVGVLLLPGWSRLQPLW